LIIEKSEYSDNTVVTDGISIGQTPFFRVMKWFRARFPPGIFSPSTDRHGAIHQRESSGCMRHGISSKGIEKLKTPSSFTSYGWLSIVFHVPSLPVSFLHSSFQLGFPFCGRTFPAFSVNGWKQRLVDLIELDGNVRHLGDQRLLLSQ
jgi:hypothetical protein